MQNNDPDILELERIITKYKSAVYGTAVSMLNNRHEADDVFQEVFLLFYRKRLRIDSDDAIKAWLIKTTVNKCRQANSSVWNRRVDKTEEADITVQFSFSDEENEVFTAVMQLEEKYRLVVYLHYFQGYSVSEIAEIFYERSNTVSVRLNRAKQMLKERLEGDIL